MRLVQLLSPSGEPRAAKVDGDQLRLFDRHDSVYALCHAGLRDAATGKETVAYDPVYRLESTWRLLPPWTHPEPARCLVSGTGLTHKRSAENRQAMHIKPEDVSDSMRMYLAGLEGGRPAAGEIGAAPEWFYKGCGTILRAHGEALVSPNFAGDGGEEPEIAGLYLIDDDGWPRRVGMAIANEFSDHVTERKNYLYLAHSKLRTCAIGPELVLDADFRDVPGTVTIERDGATLWSKRIASGEAKMSHSLTNLEHHHFQYEAHRRPGDAHVHFFGADGLSFGEGIRLEDGDVMVVAFEGLGRPLRNPIRVEQGAPKLVSVLPI